MNINAERLWNREQEVGEYGRDPRGGISRFAWTPEYREAATLLMKWMEEAGLKVRVDTVGNIYGRYEGMEDLPPVLTGSHFDTVPMGGKFDGLAGVMTALEVLTSMHEQGYKPKRPIEMIAFINEEASQFLGGHFGSKAICGMLPNDYATTSIDRNTGKSMKQAMLEYDMGLEPDNFEGSFIKEGDYFAFIEVHIEQGKYLLNKGLPLAVIDGIAGIKQFYITYYGESAHAGGMAMEDRHDSFAAAAETACEVEKLALNSGSPTRGTVGYVNVEPNEHNIVANKATISVDFREIEDDIWQRLYDDLILFVEKQCAKRGLSYDIKSTINTEPCLCNSRLKKIIAESTEENTVLYMHMISYPAHDAMQMGRLFPMGMIFLRSSNGGVSHCPDEFTTKDDLAAGANVLYTTIRKICEMDDII
ncbi:M20 family metallo-hydrolase [Paratissierella segnis]|uniref:M20 family metallo-hydrolase n=1 Tax=Paratissierella segnis TaxID=2763679 RepID=A0A926IFP5_9FIRM|nr:M20 family metallo-hydrolase [Paratissierella segnis]MBC8588717.1 M20 family metallo-hydrolase [Paratissierella segnis]